MYICRTFATPTQNEESTSHAITKAELEENSVVKYFLATSVGRQGENESLAECAENAEWFWVGRV